MPDPWAIPGAASVFTLTRENRAGLLAQRQLAAIDLLEHDRADASAEIHWTPHMLCKASSLSAGQLSALAREGIIAIEEMEVQRDPLSGRNIPPSTPLPLTAEQAERCGKSSGDHPTLPRMPTRGIPTFRRTTPLKGIWGRLLPSSCTA